MSDIPLDVVPDPQEGTIVTFYSVTGGCGRTMALANVAWILAANGLRVLAVDWNLESPGLHRFYYPFLWHLYSQVPLLEGKQSLGPGISDVIRRYAWFASEADSAEQMERAVSEHADIRRYIVSLNWEFAGEGSLDFLPTGYVTDSEYRSSNMNWDYFYDRLGGGEFIDALRANLKRDYDYVLIDSPARLSDVADICTVHLPDVLLTCFNLNTQSISSNAAKAARTDVASFREIRIMPVPMRVDWTDIDRADAGRAFAMRMFRGLPVGLPDRRHREYWSSVEVPYKPSYSYEETLAAFGDLPGCPTSLLASYERLAREITEGTVSALPAMDERLREQIRLKFIRKLAFEGTQLTVEFWPEDQAWGEWIASELSIAGIDIQERDLAKAAASGNSFPGPALGVASATYVARTIRNDKGTRPDLVVYVAGAEPVAELAEVPSVVLRDTTEATPADQLRALLANRHFSADHGPKVRYPGSEPAICNISLQNMTPTIREDCLRELRAKLREDGPEIFRCTTLHGPPGSGKTRVAVEYAHRFKSLYDLAWWIHCESAEAIEASLADLGALMLHVLDADPPASDSAGEAAKLTLLLLRSRTIRPWLLIFDGADDIESIVPYLPSGEGHVLITSRNSAWPDHFPTYLIGTQGDCSSLKT